MTKKFTLSLLLLTLTLTCTVSAQTRIACIGDSITQADVKRYSYRYFLWQKLVDAGADVDLVGSLSENLNGNPSWPSYQGQTFDADHEGHYGWRADMILYLLPNWLEGYTPDIALLHIGTNDLRENQDVTGTVSEVQQIIETLRASNPQVTVLLAQIIPWSDSNANLDQIPVYNVELATLASQLSTPQSPVLIVDQYTGFDASTQTFDGIHPNESGEMQLADNWFQSLGPLLNSGDTLPAAPTNLLLGANGTTIQLTWVDNASNESEYRIQRSTDGLQWIDLPTQAANSTQFSNEGLSQGFTYHYRVAAANSSGVSAFASASLELHQDGNPPADLPPAAQSHIELEHLYTFSGMNTGPLSVGASHGLFSSLPEAMEVSITETADPAFQLASTVGNTSMTATLAQTQTTPLSLSFSLREVNLPNLAKFQVYIRSTGDIGILGKFRLWETAAGSYQVVLDGGSIQSFNAQLGSLSKLLVEITVDSVNGTASYEIRQDGGLLASESQIALGKTGALSAYQFNLNTADTSVTIDDLLYQSASDAPAGFADWLQDHDSLSVEEQALEADPDGDGLNNLLEYALDLSPTSGSSSNLPTAQAQSNQLSFTYHALRNDLSYRVEGSSDLSNWSIDGIDQGTPDAVTGETTATVTIDGAAPLFLRLAVSTL